MAADPLCHGIEDFPAAVQSALAKIESAATIAKEPPSPIDFDVTGILPADDAPALIFGPPASLKSWLALALCDAIVRGAPFLGLSTRRRRSALYVNLDAGPKTFRNRVGLVSDAQSFEVVSLSANECSGEVLRALLERHAGGFVAIDCLSSIYNPNMHKDPAFAMREFVDDLRALYARHGCGGVVIDHPHRPKERGELGDYHGSIQKEAAFRTMWSVVAPPVDDDELEAESARRRVKITCRKLSEGQRFRPIDVVVDFGSPRFTIDRVELDRRPPDERARILEEKLLTWARAQRNIFSRRFASEAMRGHQTAKARVAFDALVERGDLVDTGKTRGGGPLYRARESGSGTHPDTADSPGSVGESRPRVPVGDADAPDTLPPSKGPDALQVVSAGTDR